jgi:hypothetical protein
MFATCPVAPATFFADKEKDISSPEVWNHILLETSDDLLLETGDFFLNEQYV